MTPQRQEEIFDLQTQEQKEIIFRKRNDYASDADVLSNFKSVAAASGCSVDMVFLNLINTKIARLRELTSSGKEVKNESIQDSFTDGVNYFRLWDMYRRELVESPVEMVKISDELWKFIQTPHQVNDYPIGQGTYVNTPPVYDGG